VAGAAVWNEYVAAGRDLGLRVQFVDTKDADDLARAFASMVRDRVGAVLVPGDPVFFTERRRIAELAIEHRLPGIFSTREFTDAGGLMSYSARLTDQFRRAAFFVDRILRGARPATLPVEQPTEFELVVNRRTARSIGLALPQAVLIRADQVIE
jgi:putative ABC transport system substrate-binding protein